LILHVRCLRELSKVLEKYIEKDKIENFINDVLKVRGTNSSFKIVFKEAMEYIKRSSETKK